MVGVKWRRMRLEQIDGTAIYLERWGVQVGCHHTDGTDRWWVPWFGVFVHRMTAPDPGPDLHDHPWTFVTVPLTGGYDEYRALARSAPGFAAIAERVPGCERGVDEHVRRWRPRLMRLDECHRIHRLHRRSVWTLVFHGRKVRPWGFYGRDGWVNEKTYDERRKRQLRNNNEVER